LALYLMSERRSQRVSLASLFLAQLHAHRAETFGQAQLKQKMSNQNLATRADADASEESRVSGAYEFLRASLPNVMRKLSELGNSADVLSLGVNNPSVIVQKLVEHRLALPYSAALVDRPGLPASASTALLKLASQLQDKHQPSVNEGILADILATLNSAGVATIIVKGAAHGRAFYPDPLLRRSSDHDILVAPECRKAAHDALCAFGFMPTSAKVFQSTCGQASYLKKILGRTAEIDLHWELGNNFAVYQKFKFQTLIDNAVKVNFGTFHALRMNDYYCALHCALNYCSDHPSQRTYLALLDLALITRGFSQIQQQHLVALAKGTQTLAVLQFALIEAEKIFGLTLLQVPLGTFLADDPLLRALEGHCESSELWWRITSPRPLIAKLKYLWFQALPPKAYMQARYSSKSNVLKLHFKRLLYALKSMR